MELAGEKGAVVANYLVRQQTNIRLRRDLGKFIEMLRIKSCPPQTLLSQDVTQLERKKSLWPIIHKSVFR